MNRRKEKGSKLGDMEWNDVIKIESSDDENIFDGDDDTFDDVLSMSNIKRKKRNQVSVFTP